MSKISEDNDQARKYGSFIQHNDTWKQQTTQQTVGVPNTKHGYSGKKMIDFPVMATKGSILLKYKKL